MRKGVKTYICQKVFCHLSLLLFQLLILNIDQASKLEFLINHPYII
jgi:hypothetical protein